jgi:cell division GTPase FtsZ
VVNIREENMANTNLAVNDELHMEFNPQKNVKPTLVADEDIKLIKDSLVESNFVFVVAGEGSGTGLLQI